MGLIYFLCLFLHDCDFRDKDLFIYLRNSLSVTMHTQTQERTKDNFLGVSIVSWYFLVLYMTSQLSVVCLHIQKKPSSCVTALRIVLVIVQSTNVLILIVITTVTIFSIMMWMRMMKSRRCSCGFCCCLGCTAAGAGTGVDVAVSARVQHSLGFVMQKKRLSARLGDRHTQSRAGVCTTSPLSWTRQNKSFVTEQVHSRKDSRFITVFAY